MTIKTQIKYLTIYIILSILGVLIASKYWWTDSFTLSSWNKKSLALVMSLAPTWIGIIYLSIAIIRKFIVKDKSLAFFGPIDLASDEFQKATGIEDCKRFKNYLSLISFPILGITIFLFIKSMKYYEEFQLKDDGKLEIVMVKNIVETSKGVSYIYFEYHDKSPFYLPNKNYKIGDRIEIKYAKEHPGILDYKDN